MDKQTFFKEMAVSLFKRKSKFARKGESEEIRFCETFLCKFWSRISAAILLLMVILIWSSSTTIISGNIVRICVSSRRLNNLYCLSAGSLPNFAISIPAINSSIVTADTNVSFNEEFVSPSINQVVNVVTLDSSGNTSEIVNTASNPFAAGGTTVDRDEEIAIAKKAVEEYLQVHRSWTLKENHGSCIGRGIYVYDLPSKFNRDLTSQCEDMVPWKDLCEYFCNDALGVPIDKLGKGWYNTHQYSLEPLFHDRIWRHPCRVFNENEAKLFYVPYYGGLDILRWHFKNVSNDVKDTLSRDLLKWLDSRKSWNRNSGKDHVFVLGKISWDFRRPNDSNWGTRFLWNLLNILQIHMNMKNKITNFQNAANIISVFVKEEQIEFLELTHSQE